MFKEAEGLQRALQAECFVQLSSNLLMTEMIKPRSVVSGHNTAQMLASTSSRRLKR